MKASEIIENSCCASGLCILKVDLVIQVKKLEADNEKIRQVAQNCINQIRADGKHSEVILKALEELLK